jgi:hypothetical protein
MLKINKEKTLTARFVGMNIRAEIDTPLSTGTGCTVTGNS